MCVRVAICLAFWAFAVTGLPAASGSDFQVASRVFVGQSVQPAGENTTFFVGEVVYDFMETGPREVTVFDAQTGDLDLIDPQRRVRTCLATDELRRFTAELKVRAVANEQFDQVIRCAADPRFETSYDVSDRELLLRSPAMTYRANGMAVAEDQARKYHRFCDWFCQLNATRPGALPPFARLQLNQQLAREGIVPRQIRLTLAARQPGGSETVLRSEHNFTSEVTAADHRRIDAARVQRAEFPLLPFHEYRGLKLQAARPSARR
jgi:hypothetical protein